ncbi:MAG: prolipoprotein diacylglyceryl transferase, partial [Carnobacterium sp.]
LIIIFVIRKFQKKIGMQFFSYFVFYGVVRFFVEGLRTDSLMWGPIRTAQLTSIVFLVVGIAGYIYLYYKGKNVKDFQVE